MNGIKYNVINTDADGFTACFADCELLYNTFITKEIFKLDFVWPGSAPRAGQFFMVKPKRTSVFLGRPVSFANWQPQAKDREYIRKFNTISLLILRKGRGTTELASMKNGEEAEIIGPLGNAWSDFLPPEKNPKDKPIALVGGGIGIAPLNALLCETPDYGYVFHAGFKKSLKNYDEKDMLLGPAVLSADKMIIASEDGKSDNKGFITDFFEAEKYSAVCACGPEAMLRIIAEKCAAAGVPCYVSLERHMACGVGACLGCAVETTKGMRRCCADGPIFPASEVFF